MEFIKIKEKEFELESNVNIDIIEDINMRIDHTHPYEYHLIIYTGIGVFKWRLRNQEIMLKIFDKLKAAIKAKTQSIQDN